MLNLGIQRPVLPSINDKEPVEVFDEMDSKILRLLPPRDEAVQRTLEQFWTNLNSIMSRLRKYASGQWD